MNTKNKNIKDVVYELDSIHGELLIATEDIISPMYFLCEFFKNDSLNYKSKDPKEQINALKAINDYIHYRYMFALLINLMSDITAHTAKLGKLISQAIELTKKTSEGGLIPLPVENKSIERR